MSVEQISTRARIAERARIHAALSDPHRLEIVDRLALSDLSPSELRSELDIGSNLLAHHLGVLEEAGLVEGTPSAGDRRRRYLRLILGTLDLVARPAETLFARRILFVCTGNSARSQFAAALWNARHVVPAESAGTRPAQRVHPQAVRAAGAAGLDLSDAVPRSIEQVGRQADLTITVCDRAKELLGGRGRWLHWSIADPAETGAPPAFDEALSQISARVQALAPHVELEPAEPGGRRTQP